MTLIDLLVTVPWWQWIVMAVVATLMTYALAKDASP